MGTSESLSIKRTLRRSALPFALAAVAAASAYFASGDSLGFWFAGVAMLTALLPPLAAREARPGDAVLSAGAVADGVGTVWFIAALLFSSVNLGQWFFAYLVLAGYGAALFGIVLSTRHTLGPTAAAAFAVILGFAWLTWPIWISPWLGGPVSSTLVAWLAPAHPLFAINRVFIEQGVWTQQALMYRLTSLGQDVPLALPPSVWPCVLVHAIMGVMLGLPAAWCHSQESSRPGASEALPSSAESKGP